MLSHTDAHTHTQRAAPEAKHRLFNYSSGILSPDDVSRLTNTRMQACPSAQHAKHPARCGTVNNKAYDEHTKLGTRCLPNDLKSRRTRKANTGPSPHFYPARQGAPHTEAAESNTHTQSQTKHSQTGKKEKQTKAKLILKLTFPNSLLCPFLS